MRTFEFAMTLRVDTAAALAAMKNVLRELIVGEEYHTVPGWYS